MLNFHHTPLSFVMGVSAFPSSNVKPEQIASIRRLRAKAPMYTLKSSQDSDCCARSIYTTVNFKRSGKLSSNRPAACIRENLIRSNAMTALILKVVYTMVLLCSLTLRRPQIEALWECMTWFWREAESQQASDKVEIETPDLLLGRTGDAAQDKGQIRSVTLWLVSIQDI